MFTDFERIEPDEKRRGLGDDPGTALKYRAERRVIPHITNSAQAAMKAVGK